MPRPLAELSEQELAHVSASTVGHYDQHATSFWEGTKDHDVSQNVDAILRHLGPAGPHDILDLGCGPGRDLITFKSHGHTAVGLDGAANFVEMARVNSGCEVWHQDFLALDLPLASFDGIFANATLFHVPTQELPRVLSELKAALRPGGILFASNPRGPDIERLNGLRYGAFLTEDTWCEYLSAAGFELLEKYFRPPGKPRDQQPWLATVWRARIDRHVELDAAERHAQTEAHESEDRWFDKDHGVQTAGWQTAEDLGAPVGAYDYHAIGVEAFDDMIDRVSIDPRSMTFVDIGAGKGRALLLASRYPFSKIVGVEVVEALAETARQNVERFESDEQRCFDIEVQAGDARQFEWPQSDLFVYMYNPFSAPIVEDVVRSLQAHHSRNPRAVVLAYYNPTYEYLIDRDNYWRPLMSTALWAVWTK